MIDEYNNIFAILLLQNNIKKLHLSFPVYMKYNNNYKNKLRELFLKKDLFTISYNNCEIDK